MQREESKMRFFNVGDTLFRTPGTTSEYEKQVKREVDLQAFTGVDDVISEIRKNSEGLIEAEVIIDSYTVPWDNENTYSRLVVDGWVAASADDLAHIDAHRRN